ncbi:MAG: STAS domain-containing protein [Planctomycetes bacterium]|nr:STAS domain-containing protein [Planctomycetota bacterium]
MASFPQHRWLESESRGNLVILRFTEAKLLDEDESQVLVKPWYAWLEKNPGRKILVDFRHVESLVSTLLAKLVAFHKKAAAQGGGLVLCCLNPRLQESLAILRLNRLFQIYEDWDEAVNDLA